MGEAIGLGKDVRLSGSREGDAQGTDAIGKEVVGKWVVGLR